MLVATSAVRDADNGEAFLGEIEWSYGFTTRLLTGEEEAELTLLGVGEAGKDALVVDIGGGSTELIGGGHRISTELGSVRLTERFLLSDPPTEDELDALGTAVRSVLAAGAGDAHGAARDRRCGHDHLARRPRPRPGRVRPQPRARPSARRRARSGLSSSASPRFRSRSGAGCPGSSRSALR